MAGHITYNDSCQWKTFLKYYKLSKFYLTLSYDEKKLFQQYIEDLFYCQQLFEDEGLENYFQIKSSTQVLWVIAANSIPQGKYQFAEKLLQEALVFAVNDDDKAHIHSNLAQIYFDLRKNSADYLEKCIYHCSETIKTGIFVSWAQALLKEIETARENKSLALRRS